MDSTELKKIYNQITLFFIKLARYKSTQCNYDINIPYLSENKAIHSFFNNPLEHRLSHGIFRERIFWEKLTINNFIMLLINNSFYEYCKFAKQFNTKNIIPTLRQLLSFRYAYTNTWYVIFPEKILDAFAILYQELNMTALTHIETLIEYYPRNYSLLKTKSAIEYNLNSRLKTYQTTINKIKTQPTKYFPIINRALSLLLQPNTVKPINSWAMAYKRYLIKKYTVNK